MLKTVTIIASLILYSCSQLKRGPSSFEIKENLLKGKDLIAVTDKAMIDELGAKCGEAIASLDFKTEESIKDSFKLCLSSYLKIPSINPKGNEELTALFLESAFNQLNIPNKTFSTTDQHQTTRFNFIATLSSTKNAREKVIFSESFDWEKESRKENIILLNHMDVVPANPNDWHPKIHPFSGAILNSDELLEIKKELSDGEEYIFGRGALDMKSVAILQMFSMAYVKSIGLLLDRDIHFLAVADEEVSGVGAKSALLEIKTGGELAALKNAKLLLNEGGIGVKNAIDQQTINFIGTEEKGGAWLKLNLDKKAKLDDLINGLGTVGAFKISLLKEIAATFKGVAFLSLEDYKCVIDKISVPSVSINVLTNKVQLSATCNTSPIKALPKLNEIAAKFLPFKVNFSIEDKVLGLTVETGSTGHGSVSIGNTALEIFTYLLKELRLINYNKSFSTPHFYKYVTSNTTKKLLDELGRINTGVAVLHWFGLNSIDRYLLRKVEENLKQEGFFRTNCQWTNLIYEKEKGGYATIDCRLLHPILSRYQGIDHAEDFKRLLNEDFLNKGTSFELVEGWNVSSSPLDEEYVMLKKILEDNNPKTIVAPYIFPAGSDSTYFRNPAPFGNNEIKAIPSYGFFPVVASKDVLKTFHGSFERFPTSEILPGLRKLNQVLYKFSTYYEVKRMEDEKKRRIELENEWRDFAEDQF